MAAGAGMRLTLLGFNLVALTSLVVPALLMFRSAGSAIGPYSEAYMAAFVLGAVCLLFAMTRLSGKKIDAAGALPLLALGSALVGIPLVMLVNISLNR